MLPGSENEIQAARCGCVMARLASAMHGMLRARTHVKHGHGFGRPMLTSTIMSRSLGDVLEFSPPYDDSMNSNVRTKTELPRLVDIISFLTRSCKRFESVNCPALLGQAGTLVLRICAILRGKWRRDPTKNVPFMSFVRRPVF